LYHQISAIAYDPDGRRIAFCANGNEIVVLPSSGAYGSDVTFWSSKGVRTLTFSEDGRSLIAAGDSTDIDIYDLQKRSCIKTNGGSVESLSRVTLTRGGSRIVAMEDNGTIDVWRRTQGRVTLLGKLNVASDGRSVASDPQGRVELFGEPQGDL